MARHRTDEQRLALVREWLRVKGDVSMRQWCRAHGIDRTTLAGWVARFSEDHGRRHGS